MTDIEVAQLIEKEFSEQLLGTTEQYLEIHQAIYDEGKLKIDRIDREKRLDLIIAYIPVKDEYFYFAVYIDVATGVVFNVGTESRNTVSLRATSENLTAHELEAFTKLKASKSWNKGDLKKHGKAVYDYSFVEYEPNPEPDEVEDKLKKLLHLLSDDRDRILKLTSASNAYINVIMDFHHGNGLLGGLLIDLECIRIMSDLNLRIESDFAAWGELLK